MRTPICHELFVRATPHTAWLNSAHAQQAMYTRAQGTPFGTGASSGAPTTAAKKMYCLQHDCAAYCMCRYQLVYAVGDPQELPNLAERVAAVQAVTRALCQMVNAGNPAVADDRFAVWQTQAAR